MFDAVIIGAGMAGVTAGRALQADGLDVVVLEATERIGGRIHTDHDFCDAPVERGAEFIHTATAATLAEAEAAGLALLRCSPEEGFEMHVGGVWAPELYSDPSLASLGDLLGDVESYDGPDQSARDFLDRRALRGAASVMADQMLSVHPLGDLSDLSMQGLRDDRVVELERGIDHRLVAGYDALPQWIGRDLDVRFGVEVARVDHTETQVMIHAADGETFAARTAVCTLPVGVLRSGAVRFEPGLPTRKWWALAQLEMGPVMKVLLRFDEPFWPDTLTMLGCDGPVRLYWTPLFGRAGAPAVLTAYVGGYRARALSAVSEPDAVAAVVADLERLYPQARVRTRLRDARRIDWIVNPRSRGGYSFVRPGGRGARAALAAADTGALFWAGDASATETIASVVHGAHDTGLRAAREVLAHLD